MSDFIERWSPNFDERSLPVSMIVLHYTGMKTGAEALDRLADPEAKVSAHYVVSEDGQITHMAHRGNDLPIIAEIALHFFHLAG